jgi:hypothetical protein
MSLDELNKSRDMLVRGKGKRKNKCKRRRKWLEGKGRDQIPKTKKKQYWK